MINRLLSNLPLKLLAASMLLPAAAPPALGNPGNQDSTQDTNAVLATLPALPREALKRYTQTDLEHWHYKRSRIELGENGEPDSLLVDYHDPSQPGEAHWQLISIDNREPSESELADYNKRRADHSKDSTDKANNQILLSMIEAGSLQPLEAEGTAQRFRYRMKSPDGKREQIFRVLEGEMLIDTEQSGAFISQTRIWNTSPFRPVLGVRIDEVNMTFKFAPVGDYILPRHIEFSYAGALLLVKPLANSMSFTLSDFRLQTNGQMASNQPTRRLSGNSSGSDRGQNVVKP